MLHGGNMATLLPASTPAVLSAPSKLPADVGRAAVEKLIEIRRGCNLTADP